MARLSSGNLAEFNGLLASVIERGLGLEPAMDLIAAQARSGAVRRALEGVARSLREGASLPDALGRSPDCFPDDYRALVKAGIEGGRLGEVLRASQAYYSLRARVSRGFARLVLYFAIGFLLCLAVLGLISMFGRRLGEIGEVLNRNPFRGLWVRYWWALLAGFGALSMLVLGGLFAASRWGPLGHLIPVWGRLQKSRELALFSTVLALRTRAGAPLLEGLGSAAAALRNSRARRIVRRVEARVREGEGLSTALFYESYFPRTLAWAVSLGEARGDVPGVFETFAGIYAAELERNYQILFQIMTPLGILALGNMVLFVVLSILYSVFWYSFTL